MARGVRGCDLSQALQLPPANPSPAGGEWLENPCPLAAEEGARAPARSNESGAVTAFLQRLLCAMPGGNGQPASLSRNTTANCAFGTGFRSAALYDFGVTLV